MRNKKRQSDSVSVSSNAGQSVEGVRSVVSHYTVNSHETVKASNKTLKAVEEEEAKKKKSSWNKFKRMIGGKSTDSTESSRPHLHRMKSHSSDDGGAAFGSSQNRRRIRSADGTKSLSPMRVRSNPLSLAEEETSPEQGLEDQSIWNRLDGVDHLSLGGARRLHFHSAQPVEVPHDWDTPDFSFSGRSVYHSPKRMFTEMLWTSSGAKSPTIIMEGFLPGVDDRWSVQVDRTHVPIMPSSSGGSVTIPSLDSLDTDEYESEDSSSLLSSRKLWDTLWGGHGKPTNMTDLDQVGEGDEALLQLVSDCSIPIDLDEDTFIVSNREHMLAVQEIAAIPLSKGEFSKARYIFEKLSKGIDLGDDKNLKFLKGSVVHNIGVVCCWQGLLAEAEAYFAEAVKVREKYLPTNHPDTIVSKVRRGLVLFALGRFDESIKVLEASLTMVSGTSDMLRAKILNNLGVVRYCKRDFATALNDLTSSLEILRQWLDGSVRRPTIVFDAATTLGNMGRLYLEGKDYDLSYFVYEEALLLQTTLFRQDHDTVLETLVNVAVAKAKAQHVKKALQILQGCWRSQTSRYGADSPHVIESTGLMGFLFAQQGMMEDGLNCLNTVKAWQKDHLQKNHMATQKTTEAISRMEEIIGKTSNSGWI